MNLHRIKQVFNIVFLILLIIFALPEFKFQVAGREIRYPGIGFSRIGVPQDYGSFRRGEDIFPSKVYRLEVELDVENEDDAIKKLGEISNQIQDRIDFAGLYQIKLSSEIKNGTAYIIYQVPQDFKGVESIIQSLSARGDITFSSSSSGVISSVDASDVIGPVRIKYISDDVQVLVLHMDESVVDTLAAEFNNASFDSEGNTQSPTISMDVDGQFAFLLSPNVRTENSAAGAVNVPDYTELLAQSIFANEGQLSDYLNVVRSYFAEESPLNANISIDTLVDQESESVPPKYNSEGGTFLALTFVISAIILLIYVTREFGKRYTMQFALLLSIHLLLLVNLLKFVQAYISIGTIIGFVIAYIFAMLIGMEVVSMRKQEEEKPNKILRLKHLRNFGIWILIMSAVIIKIAPNLGSFTDAAGVLLAFGITTIFVTIVNYRITL